MAVDGQVAFADGASAASGIPQVARQFQHIELDWGSDLRVDPLTPQLAVVGAHWHEVQINAAGKRAEESGYFSGVAELRDGRWQFRDAHWSEAAPPPVFR